MIRGERRIGAYAIAAGVAGLAIGLLATLSSVGKLDAVVIWGALLASTIRFATPLLFAALWGPSPSARASSTSGSRG